MPRAAALRELTGFKFDGLSAVAFTLVFVAMFFLTAVATQFSPLWMILVMVGFTAGVVFLALPRSALALWTFYLLTVPLGAAKWVTLTPTFFFGENPDGLVAYISDMPPWCCSCGGSPSSPSARRGSCGRRSSCLT
ncbi:MAG: hypothetical protein IPK07_08795 [Deltaproteobacteria bacterium]|nr:hypothetical protein [Deltaproteobacteria bacterium]